MIIAPAGTGSDSKVGNAVTRMECIEKGDLALSSKSIAPSWRKLLDQIAEVINDRGHVLQCSHYMPLPMPEGRALPCVIYCHGNRPRMPLPPIMEGFCMVTSKYASHLLGRSESLRYQQHSTLLANQTKSRSMRNSEGIQGSAEGLSILICCLMGALFHATRFAMAMGCKSNSRLGQEGLHTQA
eukprot:Gb_02147 [translate_table: standard]